MIQDILSRNGEKINVKILLITQVWGPRGDIWPLWLALYCPIARLEPTERSPTQGPQFRIMHHYEEKQSPAAYHLMKEKRFNVNFHKFHTAWIFKVHVCQIARRVFNIMLCFIPLNLHGECYPFSFQYSLETRFIYRLKNYVCM